MPPTKIQNVDLPDMLTLRKLSWGLVLLVAWLALVGVAVWTYAAAEVEPPAYDAFTYAEKAYGFWHAVAGGNFLNPFNLPPSVRPPGTVLMSYPFGFTTAFAGQYFRSFYIPVILLGAAVYMVGYSREQRMLSQWPFVVIALALCGMPHLYQFQPNDTVRSIHSWGLVDNFMAGVAAVAAAATVRSVRTLSLGWTIVAASTAAFTFTIKPAGLLVMAIVGVSWLILIGFRIGWKVTRLKEPELLRFASIGLIASASIYVLIIAAAYSSDYLSAANIAGGSQALAILKQDFARSIKFELLQVLVLRSFGYVVPLLLGAGIICTFVTRSEKGAAVAAVLCMVTGIWFWLVETGISQIRYFVPFGVMALIFVTPALLSRARTLPSWLRIGLAAAALAPTIGVTLLLLHPKPPLDLQQLLKVNLSSGFYRAEDEQASAFLDMVRNESAPSVFLLEIKAESRSFAAFVYYRTFFDASLARTLIKLPVDWTRTTTFRLQEIQGMSYVAFVPIRDDDKRVAILASKKIADFPAEIKLLKAWFTTLGTADGVSIVSETRLRLLRVVDRDLFGAALKRLRAGYEWRPAFQEANP